MVSQTLRLTRQVLMSASLLGGLWVSSSQADLTGCEQHFVDGDIANAPTLFSSSPDQPFDTNTHLCYQVDDTSFFAMEYWPERYAPRWAAYRIEGGVFGENGCNTYTRAMGNCYIKKDAWSEPFACSGSDASDPFHGDHLTENSLSTSAFANTGHDRGHIAPRQAFSWHACGAYQTFTMANMSPQSASLNQGIWADLEQQVLTWGIEHGPLFVVSGTIYRPFPHQAFSVFNDGALMVEQIYPAGLSLEEAAERILSNYQQYPSGHPLRPKRTANPERMQEAAREIVVPTGYYKVIFKPAHGDEPDRAIGFLLPHSFEDLKSLTEHYEGFESRMAYWAFSARIDVIEQAAGIRFPAIDEALKSRWRDPWFFGNNGTTTLRNAECGIGEPMGVILHSTKTERELACRPHPQE